MPSLKPLIPLLLLCALVVPASVFAQGDKPPKVEICHIPGGDPLKARTIAVDESALPAHLAHGDIPGPCPTDDTGELFCLVTNSDTVYGFYDVPGRVFDPLVRYTAVVHSLWNDSVFGSATARTNYWSPGGHWTQLFDLDSGDSTLPPDTGWRALSPNCTLCYVPAWHVVVVNAEGQRALIGPSDNPPGYDTNVVYTSVAYTRADGSCEDYPGGLLLVYNHTAGYWELDGSRVIADSNYGIIADQ